MTAFKWLRWDVSLFLLCVLIFVVWPQLDYWWAGQFIALEKSFIYETYRRCSGFIAASLGCNGRSCSLYLGRSFGRCGAVHLDTLPGDASTFYWFCCC